MIKNAEIKIVRNPTRLRRSGFERAEKSKKKRSKMINGINNNQNHFGINFLRGIETDAGGSQAASRGIQPNQPQQLPNDGEGSAVNDQLNPANADESKIKAGNQDSNPQQNKLQENKLKDEADTGPKDDTDLSEEDQKEVQQLKESDRKVRAHEMAHLAAAAGIAVSGANFSYTRGPDGVNYATGGEVKISISKESDPQATIEKSQQVARAAMAPADPSPQDRSVAAKARSMEAQARTELAKEQQEKVKEAQSTAQGDPNSPGAVEETDRPGQTQQTESSPTAGAAQIDRPNPGIQTYNQNQAFAPTPASQSNQNMINTSATIAGGGLNNFRGFHLDIAA